ncbi:hypothetical protein [Pseudomonas sp. NFR16]|uniref:hypothetical protein n=1 Tax=Pseudomonas sp. NFR16 TaxID=1566248 RepID=UPI0008B76959|nr:hypothetical protein [Pseudomonas sp. NFR16]SEJ50134.1 hypothetical protein SAMN03159495_3464 [Pseudomonas sp. NFR16]
MSIPDKPEVDQQAMVINEAYMEQFTNDQLAYKAWVGTDLVAEILFDEAEGVEVLMQDARHEAAHAAIALRVLVRRLTGMDPDALRKAVNQRHLEMLVLQPETEQFPAWETKQ